MKCGVVFIRVTIIRETATAVTVVSLDELVGGPVSAPNVIDDVEAPGSDIPPSLGGPKPSLDDSTGSRTSESMPWAARSLWVVLPSVTLLLIAGAATAAGVLLLRHIPAGWLPLRW
jgi:hypothetical protein